MKESKKTLSRGKVLHKIAKTSKYTIKQITERAGYKYSTFFVHVKQDNLPFEILARYNKALDHDFSNEFPEMADVVFQDTPIKYPIILSYEELAADRDKWKEKYIHLSDKYNNIIERYQKLLEDKLGIRDED